MNERIRWIRRWATDKPKELARQLAEFEASVRRIVPTIPDMFQIVDATGAKHRVLPFRPFLRFAGDFAISFTANAITIAVDAAGVNRFLQLLDTPSAYTNGAIYRANAAATALEESGVTVIGTTTTLPGALVMQDAPMSGARTIMFDGQLHDNSAAGDVLIDFRDAHKQSIRVVDDVELSFVFPEGAASGFVLIIDQDDTGDHTVTLSEASEESEEIAEVWGKELKVKAAAGSKTLLSFHWTGAYAVLVSIDALELNPEVEMT